MNLTPNQQALYNQLSLEEGNRSKPYKDTVGKITIGIGRNLTDVGLSQDEVIYLWKNDIIRAEDGLDKYLPWWRNLDTIRQRVLLDMCFNMGIAGLMVFKNSMGHIQRGEYSLAADSLGLSKWDKQVGGRADRLEQMLRTGKDYTR